MTELGTFTKTETERERKGGLVSWGGGAAGVLVDV
jgi:hypothetical protein